MHEFSRHRLSQQTKYQLKTLISHYSGEKETLKVYREMISLAARWSGMCLALGLLPSDQSTIETAYCGNPHDCLRAVVVKWLQKGYDFEQYGPPTWRMLVEAVGDPAGGNNILLLPLDCKFFCLFIFLFQLVMTYMMCIEKYTP